MKNVLFATTALVAFAGAAAAGVSWSGSATLGYNDVEMNGFYANGSVKLTGEASFDYGVSVKVTFGATLDTTNASNIAWDNFPTIVVTTNWVTLTAGDVESAAKSHYSGVSGMNITDPAAPPGDETGFYAADANYIVRADATFGNIDLSVSGDSGNTMFGGPITNMSVGASGSFGAVSFGFGYDTLGEANNAAVFGANVGTSFGGFDVDVAFINDGTDNAIGIKAGTSFGAIDVSAYYAINSIAPNEYGVSGGGTFGAITVNAYFDGDDAGASNVGVDVEYAVSDATTVYLGWDQVKTYYVGGIMSVGDGASVGASYGATSGAANHGPKKFKDGISVWASFDF